MATITATSSEELLPSARDLLFQIADVIMGVLLFVDARSDSSPSSREVFLRFLEDKSIANKIASDVAISSQKNLELNQEIVFGGNPISLSATQSKL